jgi:hypothetical protein
MSRDAERKGGPGETQKIRKGYNRSVREDMGIRKFVKLPSYRISLYKE